MNAEEVFLSALRMTIDTTAYPECRSLLEQATAFIAAGKVPLLSLAGLSDENQAEFEKYRTRIYQLYRNPSYAVGTCLHESAHGILMEDNGVQNVRFSGPGILRKADGSLFPFGARVDSDPQIGQPIDAAFIFKVTTQLVVGGVAMQKYSGIEEVSDAGDYDFFLRNSALTPQFFKDEKPEAFWARAAKHIDLWLERPEIKQRILVRAADYLGQIYS